MDVLGRFFELGELQQGVARFRVEGGIHLQQNRAVALDDGWIAELYRHGGDAPIE
jgi:hypothetical protein